MMAAVCWENIACGTEIPTGENSQVRSALVSTVDRKITGVITIRKWARYCTAMDRKIGLSKASVPFRPTNEGLSFPVSIVPSMIADLQALYNVAMANAIANYVPTIKVDE